MADDETADGCETYMVDFGTLMIRATGTEDAAKKAIALIKSDISWLELDTVYKADDS